MVSSAEPVLTLPPEEADRVRAAYSSGTCILEYGSGGSTWLAASMRGKQVISVESDLAWASDLQAKIDAAGLPSPTRVVHVDIGATTDWGKPTEVERYADFPAYPLSVWNDEVGISPDTILIDGRFRVACFLATLLHTQRAATVLFDDYYDRPKYHVVERYARPVRRIGRMAEFHVIPKTYSGGDVSEMIQAFFKSADLSQTQVGAWQGALENYEREARAAARRLARLADAPAQRKISQSQQKLLTQLSLLNTENARLKRKYASRKKVFYFTVAPYAIILSPFIALVLLVGVVRKWLGGRSQF